MKKIYILLTRSDTIVSKLISAATSDEYTHVSICFNSSMKLFYSFARKYVHSPLPAGLRRERLDKGFFKLNPHIPCALYSLDVENEAFYKAKSHVKLMMKHSDSYRFNIYGLFLCKINIPLKRKHHYFCSQFVSEVLKESNAIRLPKAASLMRPVDYTTLPELNEIYTGSIGGLVNFLSRRKIIHTKQIITHQLAR